MWGINDMKKIHYLFLLILAAVFFSTCHKKPELKIYHLELANEAVTVTTNSAIVTSDYSYPGEIPYVKLLISIESAMGMSTEFDAEITETTITANVDNLNADTKYYYCFKYSNGVRLINTEIKSFKTEGYSLPEVITAEVTGISSNTAHCGGEVTSGGNGIVSARGLCYGTRQNPTIYDNVINCGDSLGVFEADIENLDINTLYYVRAFATNEKGTGYGMQKSFTTLGQVPTVVTIPITSITSNSAVSGGTITDDGGNTVTAKGVCWSTEQDPTIDNAHTMDGTGDEAYVSNLTDLLPNTHYYVRAYATNSEGTGYGSELTFTTSAALASLTTKEVTDITQTTAKCGGNITDGGGMEITARGICWNTEHNPTINDNHTEDGSGIGDFDSELTGLSANVKYYVRAYATSDYGTSYGNEVEFTTQMGMPTVTTKSVTGITASSAQCGGEVTNNGGGAITARGVCWSTNHNPTTNDNHTADGAGVGEFTSSITGLSNNVTYYVRAYATNAHGTSYGEERSFTTQEGLAVVTTSDVTNITATSAVSGGVVTDDGGYTVIARGVCWSTSQDPTTSDAHTTNGTGTGTFTSSLTSLTYNTTYYVRAYATNSNGTSYGEEKVFTTSKVAPTVTTSEVTSVTANSAVTGGNVTSDGGASVTARGVCWGTSQNPTISGSHTTDGNGTGTFTSNLTGLTENTVYYVRAYATNSQGTSYGEQKTFITSHDVVAPTVTTNDITNVSTTSATGGGNVISAGYGTVSVRGVCWSTSQNPTISNSHSSDGGGTGAFTSNITGLTENTTYYVRAYATNEAGTAYGEQKSFTTDHEVLLPTVTTNSVTNISHTTATCGGNVTSDGGASVTARGVCWSTSQNPTISNSCTINGTGTGSFTSPITGLSPNTTYYVRAYATNSVGTQYGSQVSFTTNDISWYNGILPGSFSISSTQQVHFSQGNLQYQASTNTWRFANHQYDYIGSGNSNISSSYNGWIDLFGWGTSGYNHGANSYQPWSTSQNSSDYYVYGDASYNLNDQTCKADWGYNAISNGGNTENIWRTLTYNEWTYVFFTRTTSSGLRFALANVNGIDGVILLPDNWNSDYYYLNSTNDVYGVCSSNIINLEIWNGIFEINGAVFLPTAGFREGTMAVDEGTGVYWSASHYYMGADNVYGLYIISSTLATDWCGGRGSGISVRLVSSSNMPSSTPTVTTDDISSITATTAVCTGTVTSSGGSYVTERGVCWSTSPNPTLNNSHTSDGGGIGEFSSYLTGLAENTTYYVRAYATNSSGTSYGGLKYFTTERWASGALPGEFSVSATQQIKFAKGNLQYQASTDTWRFAAHQYDYIGDANQNVSPTYSGWIDLFCWGTSGYNHGAAYYQPWSTSQGNNDYYAYGGETNNLYDQTGQADWGYNPIFNGGNTINSWRTPTKNDWEYICYLRTTSSGIRFAKASIGGITGLVILPDNWNSSIYSLNNTNDIEVGFGSNSISQYDWLNILEPNGAVFLPTAGWRDGLSTNYIGTYGRYFSADACLYYSAYGVYFCDDYVNAVYDEFRNIGHSVRLVQDL